MLAVRRQCDRAYVGGAESWELKSGIGSTKRQLCHVERSRDISYYLLVANRGLHVIAGRRPFDKFRTCSDPPFCSGGLRQVTNTPMRVRMILEKNASQIAAGKPRKRKLLRCTFRAVRRWMMDRVAIGARKIGKFGHSHRGEIGVTLPLGLLRSVN